MFLERSRVKKPGAVSFPVDPTEYYTSSDLYIGALIEVNSFQFQLHDADDYTVRYMEKHYFTYAQSDINVIMSKLKPVVEGRSAELKAFGEHYDPKGTGCLSFDQFKCLMDQLMGEEKVFTLHELITLARHYSQK